MDTIRNKIGKMVYNRENYTDEELIDLYKFLLKPRLIEEKMLEYYKVLTRRVEILFLFMN